MKSDNKDSNQKKENKGESVDTARKVISYRTGYHELEFNIVNWFEIDATGVYAFFPQHTLTKVLNGQQVARFQKFCDAANSFFTFSSIEVTPMRISNPIVLSDQLSISTSGVTEVSSFVQSCKILHFKITDQKLFSLAKGAKGLYMDVSDMSPQDYYTVPDLVRKLNTDDNADYTLKDVNYRPCVPFPSAKYGNLFWEQYNGPLGTSNGLYYESDNLIIPQQFGFLRAVDATTGQFKLPNNETFLGYGVINKAFLQEANVKDFKFMSLPHRYMEPGETINIPIQGYNGIYQLSPQHLRTMLINPSVRGVIKGATTDKDVNMDIKVGITPRSYPSMAMQVGDFTESNLMTALRNSQKAPPLCTDFLSMIPIKTSSDAYMKIRANLKYEMKITLRFSANEFNLQAGNDGTPNEALPLNPVSMYVAPPIRELEQASNLMGLFIR